MKLDTGAIYKKWPSNHEFRENRLSNCLVLFRGVNTFPTILSMFRDPFWLNFDIQLETRSLSNIQFCKHCFSESHTLNRGGKKNYVRIFLLSRPIWTKFGTSDENVLSGCEFRENGRTSRHNLLTGAEERFLQA